MFGDTRKIYQERRQRIKQDLVEDPWLLDGARIFSDDSYNFIRLTDFSYWGISAEEFSKVLKEVKQDEEDRLNQEKQLKKERKRR